MRLAAAILLCALRSSPTPSLAWQPQLSASLSRTLLPHHHHKTLVSSCSLLQKHQQFRLSSTADHATAPEPVAEQQHDASSSTSDEMNGGSSASSSIKFVKPPRVVLDPLPTLYVYDHCPFCVRVRVALGIKNVKHELRLLANDDAATPTKLIGQKIAPILQYKDLIMKESMDIIEYCESLEEFGPTHVILPATGRADIKEWQKSVQDLLRGLQRPRYVATGLLPEFQQLESRHAFISKHPMPPFGKPEWKEMELSDKLNIYAENMAKDPAGDIEQINLKLVELDDIIESSDHCSPGGLSLDDVDLFSRLRSITIIKDVQWPAKLRAYMDNMSELADLPLYDQMAL
jgi:glutaredoxin 2